MHTVRVPLGSLAARVYRAERELLDAEKQLESLLAALYGSYSDYEYGPDGLDIYDAVDSPAHAMALFRAGWKAVRCHSHARGKFKHCACAIHRSLL